MIIVRSVVLLVSSHVEMSISASSIWHLSKCRDARPYASTYIWVCLMLALSITTAHTQTPGFHIEPTHNILFGDSMTNAGTKFMWIAEKGALRAGKVDGLHWNLDSIGDHSLAYGINTKATAPQSMAWGTENEATGAYATAWGWDNSASNVAATAWGISNLSSARYASSWGLGNKATADQATVWGDRNLGSGIISTSWGGSNTASGALSTAWGEVNVASGISSTAFGLDNRAQGYGATVFGLWADTIANTSPGDLGANYQLFTVGIGTSHSTRKNALTIMRHGNVGVNQSQPKTGLHVADDQVVLYGADTIGAGSKFMWIPEKAALRAGEINGTHWNQDSIGFHSVAFGLDNKVKGRESVSSGRNNNTVGDWCATFGLGNTTSSTASLTWGEDNETSGSWSATWGAGNLTTGDRSATWGANNTTSGTRSATWGANNINSGDHSATWGLDNISSGLRTATWGFNNKNQSLLETVIGRYADTVANASAILWQDTDQLFAIGNGTADDARNNALTIMKNGRIGLNNNAPATDIHIKQSSGTGGITLEHASDADTWLIHQASGDNLNFVFNGTLKGHIDEATGNYVQGSDTDPKTLGLIAQDVKEVFPFLVHEGEDDLLALSYSNMSVLAIKAIQEQQEIIEEKEARITSLEARISKLEKLILEK